MSAALKVVHTGADRLPTAIDLFEKYLPEYEEVQLVPIGLCKQPGRGSYLEFKICRSWYKGGVHMETEVACTYGNIRPWLDLGIAGLNFTVTIRTNEDPQHAINRALAEEVERKYLQNRRFFLRPASFDKLFNGRRMQSTLSCKDEPPIPGLNLDVKLYTSWEDHVPAESFRGRAIFAAIDYAVKWTAFARDGIFSEQMNTAQAHLKRAIELEDADRPE